MSTLLPTRNWAGTVLGPGNAGTVATQVAALGVVAAGAALVEAALIPGLLLGGAAMLAPRLLPRGLLNGLEDWRFGDGFLGDKLWRTAPAPAAPHAARELSGERESFDTWRAVVKTITYRVMVTTADFGANYVVIGELVTAAGLSSLSLVAGPIAYFAHEAAWHYYGPASARHADPHAASVDVPLLNAADGDGRVRFANLKVSRAVAKTVTYEGVTGVSEFTVNYLFVRDLAAAAGLTVFSLAIAPLVYYVHEKAWDYYDATKGRPAAAAAPKLLPAA
jgi:uncharacterized membrane protein